MIQSNDNGVQVELCVHITDHTTGKSRMLTQTTPSMIDLSNPKLIPSLGSDYLRWRTAIIFLDWRHNVSIMHEFQLHGRAALDCHSNSHVVDSRKRKCIHSGFCIVWFRVVVKNIVKYQRLSRSRRKLISAELGKETWRF